MCSASIAFMKITVNFSYVKILTQHEKLVLNKWLAFSN